MLQHTKNGFVNFKITKDRQLDSNLILPSVI